MSTYKTKGVCASHIHFEIKENKLYDVEFVNGCPGNLQALAVLLEGMSVDDVVERLKGIHCGHKATSCADQLVKALESSK